jgi:hypothetical protein
VDGSSSDTLSATTPSVRPGHIGNRNYLRQPLEHSATNRGSGHVDGRMPATDIRSGDGFLTDADTLKARLFGLRQRGGPFGFLPV